MKIETDTKYCPWRVTPMNTTGPVGIKDVLDKWVLKVWKAPKGRSNHKLAAVLHRIVACANACAGIETTNLRLVASGKTRIFLAKSLQEWTDNDKDLQLTLLRACLKAYTALDDLKKRSETGHGDLLHALQQAGVSVRAR